MTTIGSIISLISLSSQTRHDAIPDSSCGDSSGFSVNFRPGPQAVRDYSSEIRRSIGGHSLWNPSELLCNQIN